MDLTRLVDSVGFQNALPFYSARQFIFQDYLQFDGESEDPTSLTILVRYPRNARSITLSLRISLVDFTATAFVFGRKADDVQAVRDRCIADAHLLRKNPLQILGFIYDHCFLDWVSWFQELWKELAEVETATKMTRPSWRLNTMDPERLQLLSQSQNLQILLHVTFTEICHYEAAITSAVKYGKWYFEIINEVDANRESLGKPRITRRQREELEGKFRFTLVRCTAILDRVSEMRYRLSGQINVAMSLITQKDSKINLAVAEMAVRDSGLVSAIAIMTLLFLPLSLITQIWSADLFHLKDGANVLAYVISTVVMTLIVFFCWAIFARQSRKRSGAVLIEATRESSFDYLFNR
jgi:Mg2+ and Co2+ transporter CorA